MKQAITDKEVRVNEAIAYVNKIRNFHKKVYAEFYLKWKLNQELPMPHSFKLTRMGSQAVRMRIDEILKS